MISCVLLSAGLSARFGSPKALALLQGKPVIQIVQERLATSLVGEIIVVLGYRFQEIKPNILNHNKIKLVYNKDYSLGQTSSFQAGLRAIAPKTSGVMLLPVDVPLVKVDTLNLLAAHFLQRKSRILIPSFKGKKGHPPIFDAEFSGDFLAMSPATGLNQFEREHSTEIELLEVDDPAVALSFNTPEEFERLKTLF